MAAGRHLEKNGYDAITPPTIVRLPRNLAGRCKMAADDNTLVEIETIRFPKTEVVFPSPWIEISHQNSACR